MSAGTGNEDAMLEIVKDAVGTEEANRLSIEIGFKKAREQ